MTAAARGPGTCPRCFVRAGPHRACARTDLRAPGANPRAASLGLAAGLLEWAYSRSGEAGLSAEWFVAILRSLSGVRSISSSMPATEILPRGAAALLCGSLTAVRTLPAKASPAEMPRALVHSHRAAGRRPSQAAGAGGLSWTRALSLGLPARDGALLQTQRGTRRNEHMASSNSRRLLNPLSRIRADRGPAAPARSRRCWRSQPR
jgi:hypothetical protein